MACAAATLLGGCALLRPVGLAPAPDPALPQKGDPPEVLYAKAQQLYAAQSWREAGEAFGQVWKDHPSSSWSADARYYEAECRYALGKWNGAFELYQGYLRTNPLSPHSAAIERRIYDMGVFVVEDGDGGFLGLFSFAGEGIDMLDYLVLQFPNGELADDALRFMADHEFRSGRPQDAVVHLQDLLDRYPGSEWALDARYRLARAWRAMNRGTKYDGDSLRRSAAHYRAWIDAATSGSRRAEYADLVPAAREELAEVEETLASKGIETADFYLYQGKVDASRAELRNVIRDYPGTNAAAEARRRLGADAPGAPEEARTQ